MTDARATLEDECRRLSRALGFGEPSADAIEAYVRANHVIFPNELGGGDSSGAYRLAAEAIAGGHDVEAVEFALRRRHRQNPLTIKVHALVYILETQPGHYDAFHNRDGHRLMAWLALPLHTCRAAWKLAKGMALLPRLRSRLRAREEPPCTT